MRRKHRSVAVMIALCCVLAACEDVAMVLNPGAPSAFTNELVFVRVHPDVLVAAQTVPYSCPVVTPYSIGFTLNVNAGASALTLRQIGLHATDVNGTVTQPVVISGDALAGRFGRTTVPRRGSAAYPLTYSYGCGRSVKLATLHARIEAVDEGGESRVMTVEAPVQ